MKITLADINNTNTESIITNEYIILTNTELIITSQNC
jgi:hypothetical protein